MSGALDEMAEGISDKELMTQFKRIAKLSKEKRLSLKNCSMPSCSKTISKKN
jgi:hypothetical protein